MAHRICPECGARNAEAADNCDLCGLPLDAAPEPVAPGDAPEEVPAPEYGIDEGPSGSAPSAIGAPSVGVTGAAAGVYCNQCGWKNPPDARFCSRCGSRLQQVQPAPVPVRPATPPSTRPAPTGIVEAGEGHPAAPPPNVSRHIAIIVGAAVLLVVALYLITIVSKQRTTPPQPAAAATASVPQEIPVPAPLPDEQAAEVAALQEEIAALEGDERLAKQRALVNLLIGFGRPDHAATVQRAIAEMEDSAEAWRTAGNLFFDWMEAVEGEQKVPLAREAIAAYQNVLAREPGDLDVRADLAWAYQFDPQNPMQAIQENDAVLQQDPDHVQANFNRGIFLMRINRFDQAVEQFERVKQLVGERSPIFQQADAVIQAIRQAQNDRGAGTG